MIKSPEITICAECNAVDISSIDTNTCLDCYAKAVTELRTRIIKLAIQATLARRAGDTIKFRVIQRQRQQVLDELALLKQKEEAA